jgi:hypothetical protein
MKKIKLLLLVILLFSVIDTKAANYEIKELIPVNIETTIVTKNFSYKNFYYNGKGMIIFQSMILLFTWFAQIFTVFHVWFYSV